MKSFVHVHERLSAEIVHYYDSSTGDLIISTSRRIIACIDGQRHCITLPMTFWKRFFANPFRLARRLLRIDKSNVVLNSSKDGLVIIYNGNLYYYELANRKLVHTGLLRQCRNVLHCGIAVTKHGIYLGEYGNNALRDSVPIWRSVDDGRNWHVTYEFPAGSIKHIHGVYADPFSESLWITTGDLDDECFLFEARDEKFEDLIRHGDGTQKWRSVSLIFEKKRILWAMDTQFETIYLQIFDRGTGVLTQDRSFPGPVWYTKRLTDGYTLKQSTVEKGPGLTSDHAHLFVSQDHHDWFDIAQFKKDSFPEKYFKYGVIAFADGPQNSEDFVIFGEALKGLDGSALRMGISLEI